MRIANRVYILENSSDQEKKKRVTRKLLKMRFTESQAKLEKKVLQAIKKDGYYFIKDQDRYEFDKKCTLFFPKNSTPQID